MLALWWLREKELARVEMNEGRVGVCGGNAEDDADRGGDDLASRDIDEDEDDDDKEGGGEGDKGSEVADAASGAVAEPEEAEPKGPDVKGSS